MTKMSPKPLPLPVSSLTIPTALKALPQWVVWRYAWVEGKERWTKVPYRADNLAIKASSTNPETWATFEQALATYQAGDVDGLGFVLTEVCGIVGIDLDHCRDPDTGAVDAWAVDIVQAIKSYTEVSPSGTGLRLFAKGTLPGTGAKWAIGKSMRSAGISPSPAAICRTPRAPLRPVNPRLTRCTNAISRQPSRLLWRQRPMGPGQAGRMKRS